MSRRLSTPAGCVGCAALLAACAHEPAPVAPSSPTPERDVITYDEPAPPPPEPPRSRPRLSQTVTLGKGSDALTYTLPPPPPIATQAPGPNVVINNVVSPPVVYGGGYGYGAGPRSFARDGVPGSASGTTPQWGSSGWEGPRRTAGAGQTPGVGGNWPAAPSYGPAPMR